jgi:hypothetical protein
MVVGQARDFQRSHFAGAFSGPQEIPLRRLHLGDRNGNGEHHIGEFLRLTEDLRRSRMTKVSQYPFLGIHFGHGVLVRVLSHESSSGDSPAKNLNGPLIP